MMGFSLASAGPTPPRAEPEPLRSRGFNPPAQDEPRPRPPPPAALGAPPGEESLGLPEVYPVDEWPEFEQEPRATDLTSEASFSGSAWSTDDQGATPAGSRRGSEVQALLRKYLPQVYGSAQEFPQGGNPSSLLFRERSEEIPDIPLTDDFQQEYTRVTQEPKHGTPRSLRKAYRFQPKDFDKFLAVETLSPEILRVADRKPKGNPLRSRFFMNRDRKWAQMADLSRASMRLSAYAGSIANLLARADELHVTPEDGRKLITELLSITEELWSQSTRSALYTTRQRRNMALQAMGFSDRDASQIGKSIPFEGPHLFAGRALQVFDDECAYRKRADETARRLASCSHVSPGRHERLAGDPPAQITGK